MSVVVVAGPSGAGKSTLGRALAERLGWGFVEGDELHSPANIAKMAAGVPLDDADRAPWLDELARRIAELDGLATSAVLTCSALRRVYRDRLRARGGGVRFVYLDAPAHVLAARVRARPGHFAPAGLVPSQVATAETLGPDEPGAVLDATLPADRLLDAAFAEAIKIS